MKNQFISVRKSHKPIFIEALTYRWKGHVGFREDEDVGVKRSQDLSKWRDRDPILLLVNELIKENKLSKEELKKMENEILEKIDSDWDKALNAKFPDKSNLKNFVYS